MSSSVFLLMIVQQLVVIPVLSQEGVLIEVSLIYNVVLASGVQQNDSVIHIHMSPPLFLRFFSHISHYRVLSRVPCAIQQDFISYLFYI